MSKVNWTVTVDDAHVGSASSVADALQQHGFHVERVSKRSGAIFGSTDDGTAEALKKVEGVQDVRPAYEFSSPPLDPAVPQ